MDNILNRVREFIIQNNLISKNDIVGCGISGGADSIFMTFVLNILSKQMDFKIIGIHINHNLRGESSKRDERFVKEFCENLGIECRVYREDILKYSKENKISIEMGGREVRYKIFKNLKRDGIITKCSLGHHADDDVETIIMRIFKGTGTKGIEGINEIREEFYIRPILFLRKEIHIERFLKHNKIEFVLDESNLSEDYLRNKIRLSLIPYLNQKFSMDITGNILALKEICKNDNEFFDNLVKDYMDKYVKIYEDKVELNKESLSLHKSILYRMIREIIFILNRETNNVGLKHIKYICSVSNKELGKIVQIKRNLFCKNEEKVLIFKREIEKHLSPKKIYFEELMSENDILNFKNGNLNTISKEIEFLEKKVSINITSIKSSENLDFTHKNFKYFSLDNVKSSICLRNRKYGDVFTPFGMKERKKLKDFLINEKIKHKDEIPLICFDNRIAWVVGVRNSSEYKISENTKFIIKIELNYI